MKKNKKIALGTGIIIVLAAILLGASQYMLDYSLRPDHRGRDMEGSWQHIVQTYPQLKPWADSIRQNQALRDTFILAPDGVKLHAYYVNAAQPTAKTAVIVHGYTDNSIRMMMIGYMYNHELNYNILLPDLRYSGLSEGIAIQMGWLDRKDVMQWMEVAHTMYGDSTRMVVHGISMGAATTMMVSGEPQPAYVKCFVEDCGYTSVWDQFSKELKEQFGLPRFPLMYTTDWLCRMEYGWGFKEASAMKQVARCHLPMLFIHGDKDDFVPTQMVYQLYEAKPEPKELWIVPEADHARSYLLYPEEYTHRVKTFVTPYMQ